MDWLKKIPIGQYVDGNSGWLRNIDPRIKFSWVLMFLLTPVLSHEIWRVALVFALLLITFSSCLPLRIWWRSLLLLCCFSAFVGCLAIILPTSEMVPVMAVRSPDELPQAIVVSPDWELFSVGPVDFAGLSLGPWSISRRAAELGIKTSTLTFTVIHSVNLMLISTSPEHLVWAFSWFLTPFRLIGIPVDRFCFQLLLSLRFLPLVQEELQNLFRSLSTRAVDFKGLGFKASLRLLLSVSERLLLNILLRAEQGAESLLTRSKEWISPEEFRPNILINPRNFILNMASVLLLVLVIVLRSQYSKS